MAASAWRAAIGRMPRKPTLNFSGTRAPTQRLYRTGDLGRYLPDGNIEFLGREDNQVKLQGYRVELGEIEATSERHANVKAAVVTAVGERAQPKHLAAHVVADDVSIADLTDYLRQKLPAYMVPAVWQKLQALPLNANGKIDRGALVVKVPRSEVPIVGGEPSGRRAGANHRVDFRGVEIRRYRSGQNLWTIGATSMDLVASSSAWKESLVFVRPFRNSFANRLSPASPA